MQIFPNMVLLKNFIAFTALTWEVPLIGES